MHDSIVTVAMILAKAGRDHAAKRPLDGGLPSNALCLPDYLAERKRLAGQASPAYHTAPAGQRRVELAQGVV